MKITASIILLFISIGLFADTLTVKQDGTGDYTKIQDAIQAAQIGDTVLIWPGTYYENIDFIGKSITVGSLMITTCDQSYKYNTIIDGNNNGSCVVVMSGEQDAVLIGMTLQHGSGFAYEGNAITSGGGIYLFNFSELFVENCVIKNNQASRGGGGGILCGGFLTLESTSIFNNYTSGPGGGIAIGGDAYTLFDSINRCNIYNNFASLGCDFSSVNPEIPIYLYLDSCSVSNPDNYFVIVMDQLQNPVDNISFDINYGLIQPWDGSIYVDPLTGDNSNTGANPHAPLQSIAWAYSKIAVNANHRNTIHLANGIYSDTSSNQIFPLNIRPNIDVVGESKKGVIIDGEYKTYIAKGNRTVSNYSFKNMTMQRAGGLDYELSFSYKWAAFIFVYRDVEDIQFSDIVFNGGWCSPVGGALNIIGGLSIKVKSCNFIDNYGEKALEIGLSENNGNALVSHCNFIDNTVDFNHPEKRYGGGIKASGGSITVSNSLFLRNNTNAVAALFNGNNYFANCTFIDNSLEMTGTGILAFDSKVHLYNCIEYNNGDYPLQVSNIEEQNPSLLAIYHSLIQNGEESIYVYNEDWSTLIYDESNIEGDPLFLGGDWQPYNLSENSPCIDAGTMDLPEFIEIPEYDLAGNPRVVNGLIDMGAYEWNPTVGSHEMYARYLNDSLVLSPNPARDYLNIKLLRKNKQTLTGAKGLLLDIQGNIIDEIDMSRSEITYIFSVGELSTGTYFFIYDNGNGFIKSKKVVVQH